MRKRKNGLQRTCLMICVTCILVVSDIHVYYAVMPCCLYVQSRCKRAAFLLYHQPAHALEVVCSFITSFVLLLNGKGLRQPGSFKDFVLKTDLSEDSHQGFVLMMVMMVVVVMVMTVITLLRQLRSDTVPSLLHGQCV